MADTEAEIRRRQEAADARDAQEAAIEARTLEPVPDDEPAGSRSSADTTAITVKARTQRQLITRRFLAHRLAVGSLVVFIALIAFFFVGESLWKFDYDRIAGPPSQRPGGEHPFGTDSAGFDVLALVLYGGKKSLQIALTVALVSTSVGTLVGALAGFYRGWIEAFLMRITDLFLVLPYLAIVALFTEKVSREYKSNWLLLALALALFGWMAIARIVRAEFLSLREREFVEAARALGASNRRIIVRHMLPNALGPIIVAATLTVAVAILAETSLSFVNLGISKPEVSLGSLISENQGAFQQRPWLFYYPALFIVLIAVTINFVGDGLRDAFDPKQTRVRA